MAAQLRVTMPLMRAEKLGRRQVIFEMHSAQLRLCFADLRRQSVQARGRYSLFGEFTIELPFLFDQCLANRNGFDFHLRKKPLHLRTLIGIERKLVGEFKHMERPGISVEFARERQPHAAAGTKIGELLIAQRLDRTLLKPGIRRLIVLVLRERGSCQRDRHQSGKRKSHLLFSFASRLIISSTLITTVAPAI
jgi:hypothetical protein